MVGRKYADVLVVSVVSQVMDRSRPLERERQVTYCCAECYAIPIYDVLVRNRVVNSVITSKYAWLNAYIDDNRSSGRQYQQLHMHLSTVRSLF